MAALMTALVMTIAAMTGSNAQEAEQVVHNLYYIAADDNGVQQVFTQTIGGDDDSARQVTNADANVITYSIAGDGLAIAYASDGQLWLQPIHTEEAEALATLTEPAPTVRGVVFSADGDYIAYSDNGIWLLDLATRETELVLADIPMAEDAPSFDTLRAFQPVAFARDDEGEETKLVVESWLFEGKTIAVLDLNTGEVSELEPFLHHSLLVTESGKVLLYGNGQVGPDEQRIRVASSLDDLNTHEVAVEFNQFPSEGLYASEAVEISPDMVRVIGTGWVNIAEGLMAAFVLDLDLAAGTVVEFSFIDHPISELSPDGEIGVIYHDLTYTENAENSGSVELIDLTTGEALDVQLPETVSAVQWLPN